MASGTSGIASPSPRPNSGAKLVEYARFIDAQILKTRSHVRLIDVAGAMMTLAAGTIVFFLAAVLIDHWVVAGGLGFWSRLGLFLAGVAGAGYYCATRLLPLLIRRINPVYAAHTIERGQPSLKNGLVNFLLFRSNRAALSQVVYEAVEEQAATGLAKVHVETLLDRSKLIKVGSVLLGLFIVCVLYKVASPKDPLRTVGRVIMPWADLEPPTRVTIRDVDPGDATVPRGRSVTVSAEVRGLPQGDQAWVLYSSGDGQVVDRRIAMDLPDGGYRYSAPLPAGGGGAQQSFEYRIQAGDATTKAYRVEVVASPTITVESMDYAYPPYTGLVDHSVERLGEIKAIEGTRITIHARANQEINAADVVFDPRSRLTMSANGELATATWMLALQDDRRTPEHDGYQLQFKNAAGESNSQPIRYPIEVVPDLPPSVEFVNPQKSQLDVPVNRAVVLELTANDPDFALRRVTIGATAGKRQVVDRALLDEERRGTFVGKFRFSPSKFGLNAGDVVEYWAAADDNRDPQANHVESPRRVLRIVAADERPNDPDQLVSPDEDPLEDKDQDQKPSKQEQPQDQAKPQEGNPENAQEGNEKHDENQQPGDGQSSENQSKDNQPGNQAEKGAGGDSKQNEKQDRESGGQGDKSDKPGDKGNGDAGNTEPVVNDGTQDDKAFDRILKEQQRQKKDGEEENHDQPNQGGSQQGNKQNQPQPGGKQDQSQPGADQQPQEANGEPGQPHKEPGKKPSAGTKSGETGTDEQGNQSEPEKNQKKPSGRGQNAQGDPSGDDQQQDGEGEGTATPTGKKPTGKQNNGKPDDSGDQDSGNDSVDGDNTVGQKKSGSDDQKDSPEGSGDPTGNDAKQQGKPDAGKKPATRTGGDEEENPDGASEKTDKPGAKPNSGKRKSDQPNSDAREDGREDATPNAEQQPSGKPQSKPGTGGAASTREKPERGAKPSAKQGQPEDKGGDPEKQDDEKGNSGAGDSSQDQKGSPKPQEQTKPRNKQPDGDGGDQKSPMDSPQSPGTSKHESDSKGQSEGDQTGGGKKGGGQKANKPGTGGSGQNTSAEEGTGKSDEAGDGDTSDRAGDDQKSDEATGKPGSQRGKGSSDPSGDGDEQGGEQPGESGGDPNAGADGQEPKPPKQDQRQPGGGTSPGGGGNAPAGGAVPKMKEAAGHEDAANLDYARKATDLALENLKDQLDKDQVDPQLLDRLGWSREDLEKFVQRWEKLRRSAAANGDKGNEARKELDDALRSLGLRPRGATLKSNSARDDQAHGQKQGFDSKPPAEYAEQYKAYTQGKSRGKK